MKKSILVNKKKTRGRPKRKDGVDPLVAARFPKEVIERMDRWAGDHGQTRSAAVRSLIELGLTVKPKARPRADSQKQRAREMAAKAIDKMADAGASADDQAGRKRRLLKGPEEFQDMRIDRAKAKK